MSQKILLNQTVVRLAGSLRWSVGPALTVLLSFSFCLVSHYLSFCVCFRNFLTKQAEAMRAEARLDILVPFC